jgi:putative ABC transport system ATP-binding protein
MGVEGVAAIRGISFSIQPGEFVLMYGTSGGGKTTLLNIIGLIDQPTKGRLRVCGVDVRESTSDAFYARTRLENVGFVFQAFNLVSSLSAVENVELLMALLGKLDTADAAAAKCGHGLTCKSSAQPDERRRAAARDHRACNCE